MKKKKLLILLPYVGRSGGGVSEAARVLANSLYTRNIYDIEILCTREHNMEDAISGWPPVRISSYRSYGTPRFGFAPGLVWHMLANKYDVIHVHGIWMFHVFAATVGILKGYPTVVSPHGMLEPYILKRSVRLKSIVTSLYQGWALRKAKAIHTLTPKECRDVESYIPTSHNVTIPNFVPAMEGSKTKPKWQDDAHSNKTIFLFLGRIHDKKGWRNLIRAWLEMCRNDEKFKDNCFLVFCGWKDGVPEFEQIIEDANREVGNVLFAGPQFGQDRTSSYQAADFFILPSESEGLPMAVLEATRCGAISLISRACNLPEMLESGIALDCGTKVIEIVLALRRASEMDHVERGKIRQMAMNHLEDKYGEDKIVGEFHRLYSEISIKKIGVA